MESQQVRRLKLVNQDTVLSLVNRVVTRDDHAAFARLVQLHQGLIRHFLRRLAAGDHATAEDLAQETFLLAYRKIHQYQSTGTFSSWLHTIAYRLFLRGCQAVQTVSFDAEVHSAVLHRNPAEADLDAERLMRILNHKERAVITLSCAVGMSHGEIQTVTELPLGTIKSLIQRGKTKLRKHLQHPQSTQQVNS
ncbi:RNA polymerase sigma factor [Marinicella meishanensis]|uniref:RNA polymerase sigma factor n=1 Tax=Marinicella meishanensis TaxID=2873263 RepID=UPI001CBCD7C1|nr:sigma-70 family RNA polymerase sigma factor [Marinicella sp. NBU2979]